MGEAKVWVEQVIIPTYEVGEAEKNPMFLDKRVYQGSSGKVYPYPAVENQEPQPFLAIYKLTGPNQTARAHAGNRFILLSQDDAIYAAEFIDGSGWECGLTEESLTELFHLIQPDLTSAS